MVAARPLLWSLAAVLLLVSAAVCATGFAVTRAETRVDGDVIRLDAQIDYGFSDPALEALDNGVPLTVEVHIQVRGTDDWLWDRSLVDRRLRYRIRYKPLSERYLVSQLPGEKGRTYVSRDAAVAALGEIDGLALLGLARLDPQKDYEVQINASLDLEELPLPLRPVAYLRSAWKQSTGWTKWPLAH
jgi:hypothetical protein